MAKSMSMVFSGDDVEEIKEGILDYVDSLKTESADEDEPPEKKASAKVKAAAKRKAKAAAKKKAAASDNDDDFDDSDSDDGNGDDGGFDDSDDDDANGDLTIEDVRDALAALVDARGKKVAQKMVKHYGDVDTLADLDESLYRKIIENANKLVAKANA